MSERKKISFKKVLRFAAGTIFVIVFVIALVAASREQSNKAIKGFEVHLNDKQEFSFLQRKDIENWLLSNRDIKLSSSSINKLNLKRMETVAETNPWIANAEIYVDNRGILQIDVVQRDPIARIFDVQGDSYYMDSTLHIMPLSTGYAYPAPVFTNVPFYRSDSLNNVIRSKIAYLSKVIGASRFWNAQFTQIEVQPDQTFTATPLLGDQKIIIGDTSRLQEKLFNLWAFYKKIPRRIGWNAYQVLDLRYKGQIVASPTIDATQPKVALWEEPKEKAGANDNKTASVTMTSAQPEQPLKKQPEEKKQKPIKKETKQETPKYIYTGN